VPYVIEPLSMFPLSVLLPILRSTLNVCSKIPKHQYWRLTSKCRDASNSPSYGLPSGLLRVPQAACPLASDFSWSSALTRGRFGRRVRRVRPVLVVGNRFVAPAFMAPSLTTPKLCLVRTMMASDAFCCRTYHRSSSVLHNPGLPRTGLSQYFL
jgi:hypothetical protein